MVFPLRLRLMQVVVEVVLLSGMAALQIAVKTRQTCLKLMAGGGGPVGDGDLAEEQHRCAQQRPFRLRLGCGWRMWIPAADPTGRTSKVTNLIPT